MTDDTTSERSDRPSTPDSDGGGSGPRRRDTGRRDTGRRDTPWLPLGIALGVAVGVASGSLAVWIGVGTALGAALSVAQRRRER